jgi:hypothetical protein
MTQTIFSPPATGPKRVRSTVNSRFERHQIILQQMTQRFKVIMKLFEATVKCDSDASNYKIITTTSLRYVAQVQSGGNDMRALTGTHQLVCRIAFRAASGHESR